MALGNDQRRPVLLLELIVLVVLVTGAAGLASTYHWLTNVDRFLYDRVVTLLSGPVPKDVVIIGVDEQSLQRFGRWPWSRSEQARLYDAIAAARPHEVIVDIVYSEPSNPADDEALANALAALPGLALPIVIDALSDSRQLIEVLPQPQFLKAADALGHVHPELDDDGISRGVHLFQGIGSPYWQHLVLAADSRDREEDVIPVASCEAPSFSLQNIRCDYRRVPFVGIPGSIDIESAQDMLDGLVDPARLRNKTVLVGLTAIGVSDWVTTPVSGRTRPMSGVEFNANVLAAIRQGTLISESPLWVSILLVMILAAVPPLVLPRLQPGSMLLATVGFVALPVMLFYLMLYFARLYVPLGAAAVAAALTYPLWSWRRLEVAWRYVTEEIERFRVERLQLGFTALNDARLSTVVSHIAQLLGATPTTNLYGLDGSDEVVSELERVGEHDHLLRSRVTHGRRRLEVALRRSTPFNDAEQNYVAQVLASTQYSAGNNSAPIERLNAQIGQLNLLADDVRTIRDVNMKSLEQITSGVCLVNTGGLVEYANSSFTALTGVSVEDNILQIADQVTAPEGDSWEQIVFRVVVQGETESLEGQSATARMLLDCAPLRLDDELKGYWLMTAADVTEIRLVQRQREEALAFLSHDLRSPMVSILALLRSSKEGIEDDALLRKRIESYAMRSLNVSEQFVQLSRVENSEELDLYDVELGSIANNALEQVFEQAQAKNIRTSFVDETPEDGLWISGNGELLERAIVNLLTNAVKYSPEGKPVVLSVGVDAVGDALCTVKDEGYGIPAVDIGQVFEPYYRSKVREIVAQRGSGLGLRFVKTVTERHGGSVSVASEPNKGSTFTLRFPKSALLANG